MKTENIENKLERSARISSVISVLGLIIIFFALAFTIYNLNEKQKALKEVQSEIHKVEKERILLDQKILQLNKKVSDLQRTESGLLEFIGNALGSQSINRIQESIDWDTVKAEILNLRAGRRKQAVLNAVLLAWKEIPFSLGKVDLKGGFDSPGFIEYVLNSVDIKINKKSNLLLSQNIMNAFEKTDRPEPGDLMFYKGEQGYFGLIYLAKGDTRSQGVGIGTLENENPIGIYEGINTQRFPFIGYFKVKYN